MNNSALYLRTTIFGIIDSLVSTVGLLAGLDATGATHATLELTGIIYAFVEAFSMAVGNFLSEQSAQEYTAKGTVNGSSAFISGIIMFVSSVVAALIPIFPYIIFSTQTSLVTSVALSIITLFLVGMVSGRIAKLSMISRGFRMAALGGAAIIIGMVVGLAFKASA